MEISRDKQIHVAQPLESGSQAKAKMKYTHESLRENKVISVWHIAPCVIVDVVSLIVGELECSSVIEAWIVLSRTWYTAFLINGINLWNDFLKNTVVLKEPRFLTQD